MKVTRDQATATAARPGSLKLGHPRGRVPVEARLDEILGTAGKLFSDRGYSATRLDDIADELGVTRAALYYYFPRGKSEILESVCSTSMEAAEEAMVEALAHSSAPERLRAYAILLADITTRAESRVFHREVSQLEPQFRDQLTGRVQRLNAHVVAMVKQGIAEGSLRSDLDPRLATQALTGMIQWMSQWFRPSAGHATAAQVGELFADIFFDGVSAPKRRPTKPR